jgi:hypothetical protein
MIGTTGALILAFANFFAGCVTGLIVSGLILRKRLNFLRALSASLLSAIAWLFTTAWLNCSYFQNGICVDPTHNNFHNQLVGHAIFASALFAIIAACLLSFSLRAMDRTHHLNQGTH